MAGRRRSRRSRRHAENNVSFISRLAAFGFLGRGHRKAGRTSVAGRPALNNCCWEKIDQLLA
uniref:Uncharacterized protein n=1 Tax=Anopheles atroparvus TaxID=41427 RepID=A0AAG5CQ66_ANOAO